MGGREQRATHGKDHKMLCGLRPLPGLWVAGTVPAVGVACFWLLRNILRALWCVLFGPCPGGEEPGVGNRRVTRGEWRASRSAEQNHAVETELSSGSNFP